MLKDLFKNTLNRHGHPFQYAVIERARELHQQRRSPWVFEASEFPVEVQGFHTRIDFVLSRYGEGTVSPFQVLVAECKRANPSLANWIFVRAPYIQRGSSLPTREILVEHLNLGDMAHGEDVQCTHGRLDGSDKVFHLAYPVRTDSKGDSDGGRSAIEDAATQVTRGVNGFIECLAKNRRRGQGRIGISLIPAIFTTAKLFVSDVDLRQTDLARGEVDAIAELKPEPWLWLQYHVSPGLRHSVYRYLREKDTPTSLDIGHLLETEYARTIAIVGSDGVDAFLASQRWMF